MRDEEAYSALYALLEARKADHFIFTSSGAEGVNHAVFAAYLDITRKTGKNHFVCGALDEAPAIMAMSRLSELSCLHEMAPANSEGVITPQAVAETLTPRTAMVSLSWASGLTGVIQPVAEIAVVCRERGVLFHVDATHVVGRGYYTLEGSGADVLTFDGVLGGGGFFIREGFELSPFILGGEEQGKMRAGSVNRPGLMELARVAKERVRFREHLCMETARLRDRFEGRVGHGLFKSSQRLPHISLQLFEGVMSEALLYMLNRRGVYCASLGGNRYQQIEHILSACGVKAPSIYSGLSFTFTHEMTEEEVDKLAERTMEIVEQLRRLSNEL